MCIRGPGGLLMLQGQILYTENIAETRLSLVAIGCILLSSISILLSSQQQYSEDEQFLMRRKLNLTGLHQNQCIYCLLMSLLQNKKLLFLFEMHQ